MCAACDAGRRFERGARSRINTDLPRDTIYHELSILPEHLRTVEDQWASGKAYRKQKPRSIARTWVKPERDPIALLAGQDKTRLQDLVPLKYGRMGVDAFRFYRGSALLMAHDLEQQPNTGVEVVSCGDAHLSNFGFYASPERNLVFDLNDFDESAPSPWEWDVKRLVTSVILAARQSGATRKQTEPLAQHVTGTYRRALRDLAGRPSLERFYLTLRPDDLGTRLSSQAAALATRVTDKARRRDSYQAARKLLEHDDDDNLRFREDPPILTHVDDALRAKVEEVAKQYMASARPDVAVLVAGCKIIDVARRVVGVGSVGTRCYVVALIDPSGAPIILQMKEAGQSVLAAHHATSTLPLDEFMAASIPEGRRVVACQQILQAFSDSFLGWVRTDAEQGTRDFYIRQFRDMKGSFDVDTLPLKHLPLYAQACASVLARAHSQSPVCGWIAGYMGHGESFDKAVAAWCEDYADQAEEDYQVLLARVDDGSIATING